MTPSDEQLLAHAVRIARPRSSRGWKPHWVAVMETFAVGSTVAFELCARFGVDPDQLVRQGPPVAPPPAHAASA